MSKENFKVTDIDEYIKSLSSNLPILKNVYNEHFCFSIEKNYDHNTLLLNTDFCEDADGVVTVLCKKDCLELSQLFANLADNFEEVEEKEEIRKEVKEIKPYILIFKPKGYSKDNRTYLTISSNGKYAKGEFHFDKRRVKND